MREKKAVIESCLLVIFCTMFFYNYALSQYIFVLQVVRDSFYTFGDDPKAARIISQNPSAG